MSTEHLPKGKLNLLPCPWCGGTNLNVYLSHEGDRVIEYVQCMDCTSCGPDHKEGRHWNRHAALLWRPIETAPKDGYFLVWCPDEKIGGLIEHWSAKNFHDPKMREQWAHLGIPTHWMPIPEAPTP